MVISIRKCNSLYLNWVIVHFNDFSRIFSVWLRGSKASEKSSFQFKSKIAIGGHSKSLIFYTTKIRKLKNLYFETLITKITTKIFANVIKLSKISIIGHFWSSKRGRV